MKRSSDFAAGGASKRRCTSISVGRLGSSEAQYARLAALWRQGLYCDVRLRVGTELFPAHRLVLAAESTFLATLFAGQFKDSLAPIVDLHDMKPRAFALALDYMYDGTFAVPDVSTLEEVLSVAAVLQIDSLLAAAATALEEGITVDNCACMLACADRYHIPKLALKAEALACNAFVDVASNPAVPASSLVALLQSDHLHVQSEEQVFETLYTWLQGQTEPLGEEEQLNMFGLIRFTLLTKNFTDSTVMSVPIFKTLRGHTLLLNQLQALLLGGGDKPTQRGNTPSEILSAEAHRQVLSLLDKGAATKLELLYRASNDGLAGRDFHSRCDFKGPTLTVIKCTDGYVFGGFTSTSWASQNNFVACADAFIFSLHRPGGAGPVKLALRAGRTELALFDDAWQGPNFGETDIDLGQFTEMGVTNSTNLESYELPPGHPRVDANAFFTGSEMFRTAEVEVFSVTV